MAGVRDIVIDGPDVRGVADGGPGTRGCAASDGLGVRGVAVTEQVYSLPFDGFDRQA